MKTAVFKFGRMELHPGNIALSVCNEGINLNGADAHEMLLFMAEGFEGFYGFVASKENAYSLELDVFKVFGAESRLIAIAVLATQKLSMDLFSAVERGLVQKPVALFTELEEAKAWLAMKISEAESNTL